MVFTSQNTFKCLVFHLLFFHMKAVLDWTPTISVEEGFGRVLKAAHERIARGEA